jgi:hypothetical protein
LQVLATVGWYKRLGVRPQELPWGQDMTRREFIALLSGTAGWPLATHTQQPDRMQRIAVLIAVETQVDPIAQTRLAAFKEGLEKLGLEGKTQRAHRCSLLGVAELAAQAERPRTNPVGCSRHGRCVWHRVDHIGKMAARRAHRVI